MHITRSGEKRKVQNKKFEVVVCILPSLHNFQLRLLTLTTCLKLKTILLAPDKFKGSLASPKVCSVVAKSLSDSLTDIKCISLPLADGGEGSCALLTSFAKGTWQEVEIHDPLFRRVKTRYGVSNDGTTAFMEMASASGLQLLLKNERNPMKTSTFGTGEMIRHAIDHGIKRIIMGIGGSATNDGGMGMAEALGLQCFDRSDKMLHPVGGNLREIHRLDTKDLHPALRDTSFTLFCDVDNPLHGARGAAYVFAPQKGASPEEVDLLDEGLRHLEKIMRKNFGGDFDFPAAGAGGGLAVALKALTTLTITPGMKFIAEFTGLARQISQADLVITGEGHLDEQTFAGKVVKGVADLAKHYRKPVIALAGKCSLTPSQIESLGLVAVVTLVGDDINESDAIEHAPSVLRKRVVEKVVSLVKALSDGRNP